MAYRYKIKARVELPTPILPRSQTRDEELTGFVQGQKASDLEEMVSKGFDNIGISYTYQYPVQTAYTLPGKDKQVDFLTVNGSRIYPIEVYGPYFHETQSAKLKDGERERQLNAEFRKMGIENIRIIWHWQLYNQESANDAVKEVFY